MKKAILLFSLCLCANLLFGQAKKPTLMIVPGDVWCTENNYMDKFDNQGTEELVPNYKKAFQSNMDLVNVIAKINTLMADRDFPLKDLSATIKDLEQSNAMDNMTVSKTSGAQLMESPLDQLKRVANADIIIEVNWKINSQGPKKSVTYNLTAKDAYTNKQVAGAQGTGAPSFTAEVPVLLEEAVLANMDNFTAQLQNHFEDMAENGREVTVEVRIFDNGSGVDFETEYEGTELTDIIDDWMAENTEKHRYNLSAGSENFLKFEQVRIPLFQANGRAMDTRRFVNNLRKYLSGAPYNLTSKVEMRGLGKAILIIGEK